MKKTTKILSLILSAILVLTLILAMSITASASTDNTDYTGYHKITNAGNLAWFACLVVGDGMEADPDAKAVLTADIDLSDLAVRFNKSWSAIGTAAVPFTGIFDGNGYTIRGLTIDSSADSTLTNPTVPSIPNTTTEQGLFGVIGQGAIIHNLVLEGTASVSDGQKLGAVCSQNGGIVENVLSKVTVEGGTTPSALCHTNSGSIVNCFTTVSNTANAVTVTGDELKSGSVTHALGAKFGQTISVDNQPVHNNGTNTVYKVYECDGVTTVYRNVNENVPHSTENDGDTAGTCKTPGYCSVCGTEYGTVADVHEGEVTADGFYDCCDAPEAATLKGIGENGAPLYEISNAGQLYWFAALVNTGEQVAGAETESDASDDIYTYNFNARLTKDITVNPGSFTADGNYNGEGEEAPREWVVFKWYQGSFDGNGKVISGLYLVDRAGLRSFGVGLFGSLGKFIYTDRQQPSTGEVFDLGITNSYFEGEINVGSITGSQYLGTTIKNCWSDAFVLGGDNGAEGGANTIGGLVGEGRGGVIENSIYYGTVTHEVTPTKVNIIGAASADFEVINSYSPYGENEWHDSIDQPDFKSWYKSREAFASGEVAVLINKALGFAYFGQLLGVDNGPRIGGATVYENVQLNCTEFGYSNSPVANTAHIPEATITSDTENHWYACSVEGCTEKLELYAHAYDSSCDTVCNVCDATRATEHKYDNSCDTVCNICDASRLTAHVYDNDCDTACNICGIARATTHVYDNSCDTACNVCAAIRTTTHVHDNFCDTSCNVCGATRSVTPHLDVDGNEACDVCGTAVEKKDTGLSAGAGVGIGIGATAAVFIGGFSLLWFVIKRKTFAELIGFFKS